MTEKVLDCLELAEMELDAETGLPIDMEKFMPGLMHESLGNFRLSIDSAIRVLLRRMMEMNIWEGSLKANLKVNLLPDANGGMEIGMKHKVGVNVPVKAEIEGECADPYKIKTNTDSGEVYVIPGNMQISIFDE